MISTVRTVQRLLIKTIAAYRLGELSFVMTTRSEHMQSERNVQASAALMLNKVHTSIGCAVVESSMMRRLLLAKGLCKWAVAASLCCTRCGIWALSTHWTCSSTLLLRA